MSSPTYDLATVLEDLAAGRIDPTEAARRIDAASARPTDPTPTSDPAASGPASSDPASSDPASSDPVDSEPAVDPDAWAASTDRPQRPGQPFDPFPGRTVDPGPSSTTDRPGTSGAGPTARGAGAVTRISVRAVGRRVRVIGEHTVATVAVDGPHVLRRNGSVMEISSDGEVGASIDGFQLLRGAPRTLEDLRNLGLGKELLIRVNPAITVDIEVTAGSLNTERVPVLGKIRVTAGGAKLLDVEEVADALVQAGQATIRGTLREGRSKVKAESGSLVVQLGDRSDVTITSESQLGKVNFSGGHTGAGDEVVMGSGRARLDVAVVMGYATIQAGSAAEASA